MNEHTVDPDSDLSPDAVRVIPGPPSVPEHAHIVVDEETYWGLMYLHIEVKRQLAAGAVKKDSLAYYSEDAERRLEQARRWNALDPGHK